MCSIKVRLSFYEWRDLTINLSLEICSIHAMLLFLFLSLDDAVLLSTGTRGVGVDLTVPIMILMVLLSCKYRYL